MSWFMVPLMSFRAALAAVKPHAGETVRLVPLRYLAKAFQ